MSNDRRALLWVAIGFVVSALLLDSHGLRTWAERLEIGSGRKTALAVATAVQQASQVTGSARVREVAVANIGREETARWAKWQTREPIASPDVGATVAPPSQPIPEPIEEPMLAVTASGVSEPPQFAEDRPLRVALVGDSMMAVGLGPLLKRTLGDRPGVELLPAFRSGTGLARPEIFDWQSEYPKLLQGRQPDVVICAIGANDGQGFVEAGKVHAFGSPSWETIYRRRLDGMVALITRDARKVIWVTLPVMRSAKFSAKVAILNDLARSVLAAYPQVQIVDSDLTLADESRAYRAYAYDAKGKLVSLRQEDGIHLTDAGARMLVARILPDTGLLRLAQVTAR